MAFISVFSRPWRLAKPRADPVFKLLRHEWKYGIAFENAASPSRVEESSLAQCVPVGPQGQVEWNVSSLTCGLVGLEVHADTVISQRLASELDATAELKPLRLTGHEPDE